MTLQLKLIRAQQSTPPLYRIFRCHVSQRLLVRTVIGLIVVSIVIHLITTHSVYYGTISYNNGTFLGEVSFGTSYRRINLFDEHVFPRIATYYSNDAKLLVTWNITKRYVKDMGNAKNRARIINHDELDLDDVENDICTLPHTWQKSTYPTCNIIHEFDGTKPGYSISTRRHKSFRMIGNGFWRDVWIVNFLNTIINEKGILKTMRYNHDYTPRNFDRMRRDSIVMERLTKSLFIVNIFSFCGTSSFTEYGDGGDIPDAIWFSKNSTKLTKIEKLRIATQAAIAVAAVHNIDREGYPSIAHTDISPAQYVKVNGIYKLNDFNRARFIAYNGNDTCPYLIGTNPGKNRSPEEYNYEPQTEKVDIYSLGNIFYMLLQEEWPFFDVPLELAYELVKNGTRPSIYEDLWYSTDPIDVTLKEAMIMCHEHKPEHRVSARTVERYLLNKMRHLDPEYLDSLGFA